jgi:hypothetical protein
MLSNSSSLRHHHQCSCSGGSDIGSFRSGSRLSVPSSTAVDRRSGRAWSPVGCGGGGGRTTIDMFTAAAAAELDDTENEDVQLTGTMLIRGRGEVTDAEQSVSLLSAALPAGSVTGSVTGSAAGSGGGVRGAPQSQRTTPDVIRPAGGGPPVDAGGGEGRAGGAVGLAGTPLQSTGRSQRPRRQHNRPSSNRRRPRSPAYHRPGSAGHGRCVGVGSYKGSRQSAVKSDLEMSDRKRGTADDDDTDSEFSESTTCRDSGMDPSEDSDHTVTYSAARHVTS